MVSCFLIQSHKHVLSSSPVYQTHRKDLPLPWRSPVWWVAQATGGEKAVTSATLEAQTRAGSPTSRERQEEFIPWGRPEAPGTVEARLFSTLQGAELLQTAALLGVLLLGFGYFWLLVPNIEARLQQLGLFCSVFTISMYLSPLTDLVSGSGRDHGGGEIRVRLP